MNVVHGVTLQGIKALKVEVEVEITGGLFVIAVVGLPDPVRGEEPKAFLVLNPGMDATIKDMAAFCRQELASYKCPRSFEFLEALPRDAEGRIRKELLRARHKSVS